MGIPSNDMLQRMKGLAQATHASCASGASTKVNSSALAAGIYYLTVDGDVYWRQGDTNVAATAPAAGASSRPLWSKERVRIHVQDATNEGFIAIRPQGGAAVNAWIEEAQGG